MITEIDIKHGITWSQTGLEFLSWIHVTLLAFWGVIGLIDGFCEGIFHVAPIAWEIILIKFNASCIGFGIQTFNGHVLADGTHKIKLVWFVLVLYVIAVGFNITQFVFTIIEVTSCTTYICLNSYWVLIVFSVVLGVLIVLEIIEFAYFIKYLRHLRIYELFLKKK
jgi:hypothetical protein